MQAVLSLPNSYRNVIYLFYYEGYKAVDIAHILHKKENTIHTWLKRDKKQLKDRLGGDYLNNPLKELDQIYASEEIKKQTT